MSRFALKQYEDRIVEAMREHSCSREEAIVIVTRGIGAAIATPRKRTIGDSDQGSTAYAMDGNRPDVNVTHDYSECWI